MNVPKLRFKEFTDEWKKVELDKLYEFKNGLNGDRSLYGKGVELINVSDILNNTYITSKVINGKININEDTLRKNSVEYGDILFQRSSETFLEIGTSNVYLDNKLVTFSGFVIRGKRKKDNINNPLFINYVLKSPTLRKKIIICGSGAQHYNIGQEDLKRITIFLPSIKEQKKIADMLELLDKKIELQTKKIEALKLFKLSITQNIFNEKKLNDFQSVTLEKILKPGSKIPVKNTSEYEKMTVKLNFKGLAKLEIKKEMADTRPFYVRNENEIIIGKQNYFNGSIAKVTKDFKGCICSNAIMSFTTINGVNVDYVLYYLSQKNYINRRKFLANGTGQKELSEKEFLKFVIKLPSTQIQNDISKKISCVSNLLLLENKKLTTLNNLKKGLLQNLFI